MSEPLSDYPNFELDFEQDEIRKQSLVNQARNWINLTHLLLFF